MQATLQPPERVGREHVDSLSHVLSDFQNERARLETIAQELSGEWQQLCDDLAECSASLEQDELELDKRSQAFAAKMRSASENNVRAEELERQLHATQAELERYRQEMEQTQQERSTVRQQLQDVNSGVLSLSELIRVVQSTYTEIEQVQAALGQQAIELLTCMEGNSPAPTLRPSDPAPRPSVVRREVADDLDDLDETPNDEDQAVEESTIEAEGEPDDVSQAEETVSDPVIGSVLAELTRLGKK